MKKFISGLRNKKMAKIVVLALIAIVASIVALAAFSKDPEPNGVFNKERSSSGLKTMEVYFLDGPFAENIDTSAEFFVAYTEDDVFVLSADKYSGKIPVYGEDITESDLESLEPVLIEGRTEYMEEELKTYLMGFYNEITADNLEENFGAYYFDTTYRSDDSIPMVLFFAAIVVISLLISAIIILTSHRKLMKGLRAYEENGLLAACEGDFLSAKDNYDKKLKIVLSRRYLYNFKTNLLIIPLDEIINAYSCSIINNKIQNQEFIAIETNHDAVYYITPKRRAKQDNAVDTLRDRLRQIARENNDGYHI